MPSKDTAVRRLKAILPKCSECRVLRPAPGDTMCQRCRERYDWNIRCQWEAGAYIALHGQEAYDEKLARETKELF